MPNNCCICGAMKKANTTLHPFPTDLVPVQSGVCDNADSDSGDDSDDCDL